MGHRDIEADAEEDMATNIEEAIWRLKQVLRNGSMNGLDGERWRRRRKGSVGAIGVLGSIGEDSHGEGEGEWGPANECTRSLRKAWPRL